MGVLENVVVFGKSGADLETELLHHQTSPPDELESTGAETFQQQGGSSDVEHGTDDRAMSPPEANPPAD